MITQNQLLRYILKRQGLLERLPLEAIESLGVLHATDTTTPYLSLLARLDGFQWQHFADRLYQDRRFARLRCMRGTLHMVPQPYIETVRCAYTTREEDPFPPFKEYQISWEEARELRFYITELLQQYGSLNANSIKKHLDPRLVIKHKNSLGGESTSIGHVLRWMWSQGLLESGSGVSDWRKKDETFRLADSAPCYDTPQGDLSLCRWYFEMYAPATYEDWVWWSGLKAERARPAFAALQPELVEVRVQGMPESLVMLASALPALQQTPDEPPQMVRLLPYEDALIKAYKQTRYRFYDAEGIAEDAAFNRTGEAYPSIWVDGRIMGVWSWAKKDQEPMTLEPFVQMTRPLRKRIQAEVEAVQAFIGASHTIWTS